MSLSMEVGMAFSTSLGRETMGMDCNVEFKDNAASLFQRFHCVIVLKYFWLKEEMTKSTAMSVTNGLYQAQNGQNGSIAEPHYERIRECHQRRPKVEILLKYILRSTKETYTRFLHLLRKSDDEHIAKSLEECLPTASQIQEFNQLQFFSLGNGLRPDYLCRRFYIPEGEIQKLIYMLNDVTTIETISDYLLSSLFFSIREHTNITSCPSKDEQRITSLLQTMMKCSHKISTPLKEVLDWLKMGHVFTSLSEIRRGPSDQEQMEDNDLPTKVLDGQVERNIREAFQAEPKDLRMKALKEFPFEVEEMETGSIMIRLRPISEDSWQKFEKKCSSGDIKNFIASVYDSEVLEEGRYEIDVKIYQEICSDKDDCMRAIIYLKDKNENEIDGAVAMKSHDLQLRNDGKPKLKAGVLKGKESYIDRHMDLLCEEMDVSRSLLLYLSQHDIIDESVKEELKKTKGRAQKVRCLLTELSLKNRAEDMLKRFIQQKDSYLFKHIESMEKSTSPDKDSDEMELKESRVSENGSAQKHSNSHLYFTAVAILMVKKSASMNDKEVKTNSSAKGNLQLWCSKLVDPVCHFKEKTNKSVVQPDMRRKLDRTTVPRTLRRPTSGVFTSPCLAADETVLTQNLKWPTTLHRSQRSRDSGFWTDEDLLTTENRSKGDNEVHAEKEKTALSEAKKLLHATLDVEENVQESTTKKKNKHLNKIFVGNVDPLTTESTIKDYFELYGKVEKIDFPRFKGTGGRRKFIFVEFSSHAAVTKIMGEKLHVIGMNEVRIQIAGSPKATGSDFERRRRVDEPIVRNETTFYNRAGSADDQDYPDFVCARRYRNYSRNETTFYNRAGSADDQDYPDFVCPRRYRNYSFGNYRSGYKHRDYVVL